MNGWAMISVTRGQAAALGVAAAMVLSVAWLTDAPAGPVMAAAGGIIGWLVCRLTTRAPAVSESPAPPLVPASGVAGPCVEAPAGDDRERALSSMRHDVRSNLAPAMLLADRLITHEDPAVRRAGDLISKSVERAAARLSEKAVAGR